MLCILNKKRLILEWLQQLKSITCPKLTHLMPVLHQHHFLFPSAIEVELDRAASQGTALLCCFIKCLNFRDKKWAGVQFATPTSLDSENLWLWTSASFPPCGLKWQWAEVFWNMLKVEEPKFAWVPEGSHGRLSPTWNSFKAVMWAKSMFSFVLFSKPLKWRPLFLQQPNLPSPFYAEV